MNLSSFDKTEITTNLWMCGNIEPHLPVNSTTAILNCGYNILGFMLLSRNNNKIKSLTGIDLSQDNVTIANKVLDMWTIENRAIRNVRFDPSILNYEVFDTVICLNCDSISDEWFQRVPEGTLVCILDTNTASKTLEDFFNRYPLTTTHVLETLPGGDRFMHVGIK